MLILSNLGEQKITLSEAASLGQPSVFLKHLPDRKDTMPAREKDAPKPAGPGGARKRNATLKTLQQYLWKVGQ